MYRGAGIGSKDDQGLPCQQVECPQTVYDPSHVESPECQHWLWSHALHLLGIPSWSPDESSFHGGQLLKLISYIRTPCVILSINFWLCALSRFWRRYYNKELNLILWRKRSLQIDLSNWFNWWRWLEIKENSRLRWHWQMWSLLDRWYTDYLWLLLLLLCTQTEFISNGDKYFPAPYRTSWLAY